VVTREYRTAKDIIGPLVLVDGVEGVTYGELTDIKLSDGSVRRGRVLEVNKDKAVVQVFEGTSGLSPVDITVKFLGKGIELGVSIDMLGRIFDGFGRPIDDANAHAAALPDRLDDESLTEILQLRLDLAARRPPGDFDRGRHGHTSPGKAVLAGDLVERQPAGLRAATGIDQPSALEHLLEPAVLAELAMQSHEKHVDIGPVQHAHVVGRDV